MDIYDKNMVFSKVLKTCGQEEVTYLITKKPFFFACPCSG